MVNRRMQVRPYLVIAVFIASPSYVASASEAQIAATPLPSEEEILTKYEHFLGGPTALSKINSRITRTRRVELSNEPSEENLVRYSKRPMLSIMHHEALDGTFVRWMNGCDSTGGWVGYGREANESGVPKPGEASTDGNCEQEQYYYEYLPLDLGRLKADTQFEVTGATVIVPMEAGPWGGLAGGHGRELVPPGPRNAVLVLSVPRQPTDQYAWLYFDVETGALLRRAEAGRGPKPVQPGMNPRYTDFIQYREVGDGTRAPFQFVTTAPNSQVRGVSTSIVDNGSVKDESFSRPKDVRREDKAL